MCNCIFKTARRKSKLWKGPLLIPSYLSALDLSPSMSSPQQRRLVRGKLALRADPKSHEYCHDTGKEWGLQISKGRVIVRKGGDRGRQAFENDGKSGRGLPGGGRQKRH